MTGETWGAVSPGSREQGLAQGGITLVPKEGELDVELPSPGA